MVVYTEVVVSRNWLKNICFWLNSARLRVRPSHRRVQYGVWYRA